MVQLVSCADWLLVLCVPAAWRRWSCRGWEVALLLLARMMTKGVVRMAWMLMRTHHNPAAAAERRAQVGGSRSYELSRGGHPGLFAQLPGSSTPDPLADTAGTRARTESGG
jgi:hypothetical protein